MSGSGTATVAELLQAAGCAVNPGRGLVRAGLKRKQADRLLATPLAEGLAQGLAAALSRLLDTQAQGGGAESAADIRALALQLLDEPGHVRVFIDGPPWLDPDLWLPPGGRVCPARAREVHHLLHGRHVAGHRVQVRCEPPLRIGRRPDRRQPRPERRRQLFSRWDQGVRWDEEGLFSATPEALADDLVAGACGVALDAGCGLGSLALALARAPAVTRVIAVEQDATRIAHARHNAVLYGVGERIHFVHGDAVEVLSRTPCDVLVADPPWGGRDYDRETLPVSALGLDLVALLAHAPADTRLKLPPSISPETLPGPWTWRPGVDERGVLKHLVATRA